MGLAVAALGLVGIEEEKGSNVYVPGSASDWCAAKGIEPSTNWSS